MSEPEDHSGILERVRKLLALSKSDNVHEAALAAERAHKLMLEHRLAMDDVAGALPGDVVEDEIAHERMMAVWRFGLLTACARSYYCAVVRVEEVTLYGHSRTRAVIMGRKDDVAAVKCLFLHFENEIDRLNDKVFGWDGVRDRKLGMIEIEKSESWKRGAVVAIQDKLRGQRMMFEREDDKALLAGDRARQVVSEYQAKKFPDTYRPDMAGAGDKAFERGYRAGLDVAVPVAEKKRLGNV